MNKLKRIFADSETTIIFIIIIAVTIIVALLLSRYLQKKIEDKTKEQRVDTTSFLFIKHMIVATVYFVGFGWALLTLPITRTFAHSLLAGAGATTLILGFASQHLFNNIISGIFLVINRPFKINDVIEFQNSQGKVVEINLNNTVIVDANGNKTIIPSALILNDKIKIINSNAV